MSNSVNLSKNIGIGNFGARNIMSIQQERIVIGLRKIYT